MKIKIAGVGSMKVPSTNKITFIINRIIIGLLDTPSNPDAIKSGIFVKARIHDIIEDKPIKNTIILVSFADSSKILGKSDTLMFL